MGERKIDFHRQEEEEKKKLVPCINYWKGCGMFVPKDNMNIHVALRCNYRQVLCRLNCEKYFPFCKLEDHEMNHCKFRIISCDLCGENLPSREISNHMKQICPMRMVMCSLGCGRMFKAKDVIAHEEAGCILSCKYNCG